MIDLGRSATPPSQSDEWAIWARPVAAFLRAPQTIRDVERFCRPHGARSSKAANLLHWLELAGHAYLMQGVYYLTDAGRAWLGDFHLSPEAVEIPEDRPSGRYLVGRALDLTAEPPFTRLVPREIVGSDPNGGVFWRCDCACGTTKVVSSRHLRARRVRSCGCLRAEMRASGVAAKQWKAA